jgi:DNA-binding transcriptional ArsR family regulator
MKDVALHLLDDDLTWLSAQRDGDASGLVDALITGEKAVGEIVHDLSMSQPQVSKHLRVLSEVGLVRCRADGRRRLYRLEPARLRPFHEWLAKYEQAWNDRLDRMDDYLQELQQQGEQQ